MSAKLEQVFKACGYNALLLLQLAMNVDVLHDMMAILVTAKLLEVVHHCTNQCCHLRRDITVFYEPLDYAATIPVPDHIKSRVLRAVDLRCNEGEICGRQHLHDLL